MNGTGTSATEVPRLTDDELLETLEERVNETVRDADDRAPAVRAVQEVCAVLLRLEDEDRLRVLRAVGALFDLGDDL